MTHYQRGTSQSRWHFWGQGIVNVHVVYMYMGTRYIFTIAILDCWASVFVYESSSHSYLLRTTKSPYSYLPPTTHYSLLTTHYTLLTTHYSLLTTHYSLRYSLLTARYLPLTSRSLPLTTHLPLFRTRHVFLIDASAHHLLLTTPYALRNLSHYANCTICDTTCVLF